MTYKDNTECENDCREERGNNCFYCSVFMLGVFGMLVWGLYKLWLLVVSWF